MGFFFSDKEKILRVVSERRYFTQRGETIQMMVDSYQNHGDLKEIVHFSSIAKKELKAYIYKFSENIL